jgi:hypothetical protein
MAPKLSWFFLRKICVFAAIKQVRVGGTQCYYSDSFKETLEELPLKVSIFGWWLLLEKLPTRKTLYRKGVITNNHERCCVLCFREVDDIHDVLINCCISVQVWQYIFKWMDTCLTAPLVYNNISLCLVN